VLVAESRGEARPEAAAHLAREGGRPRRARSREQERRVRGGRGGWPWRAQASIGVVFDVVLDRLILDGEEKDGQMGEENKFS
jgi:hypothetical protein